MGRPAQPERRLELLDRAADHALAHGLPDGLEPFSAALGVSGRMLLYHFGTRDGLLRAVLERARERQLAEWGGLFVGRPGTPYTATLARAWTVISGPSGQPYLRMFGELRQSSEERLWPGFRRLATTEWLAPIGDGLRGLGRPELATLVLAVIRGLLMDLEATGDRERVDAAFRDLLRLIDERDPGGQGALFGSVE